jgi:hypothetical protein
MTRGGGLTTEKDQRAWGRTGELRIGQGGGTEGGGNVTASASREAMPREVAVARCRERRRWRGIEGGGSENLGSLTLQNIF